MMILFRWFDTGRDRVRVGHVQFEPREESLCPFLGSIKQVATTLGKEWCFGVQVLGKLDCVEVVVGGMLWRLLLFRQDCVYHWLASLLIARQDGWGDRGCTNRSKAFNTKQKKKQKNKKGMSSAVPDGLQIVWVFGHVNFWFR